MTDHIDWANEPADYRLDHKVASGLFGEDSPDGGHLIGRCVDWSRVPELLDAAKQRWPTVEVSWHCETIDAIAWTVFISLNAHPEDEEAPCEAATLPLALCRAIAMALDAEEAASQ